MKQLKLLSTLILSGALVACGGGSDSPSKPDLCDDLGFEGCNLGSSSAQSSSSSSTSSQGLSNNVVPFHEDFSAINALDFFSPGYKALDTVNPDDMNNAFYYSTSGLESGRMVVGDGKFTIGNARFTIGQTLVTEGTHLNPDAPPADYKVNTTTPGDVLVYPTTTTWGELDLSKNWKMSFCVVEWEHTGNSANNQLFQVMLDNNQSASGQSIHGDSRVKELNVANFTPGKRVEINVPGDVLVGGVSIDGVVENKGTATSFIQVRVPSAAVLTMADLWIGYQSDTSTEPSPDDCSAGTRVPGWNVPLPPVIATAPVLVAGNGQISVDWEAADRATEYTVAYNTVNSTTGATLISDITETETVITGLTNNTEYFVFVQGVNDGGSGEFSPGASATPVAPLVAPTTPTELTLEAGDQQLTATWNSVAGAETYTLAYNLVNDAVTGATLVEDIPADALSETISHTITGLSNGNSYYVFVKAMNAAGESDFTVAESAAPVAPAGGDQDYTWGFNPAAYQAIDGFFAAEFTTGGNNEVSTSEEVREADGLLIFLNSGTAIRYRGNDDRWNFNGRSWAEGDSVLVPAIGEAAPELRAYIGFPIDIGREVTLTVNYQQSSGGGVASGKIVLIGSDNTILAQQDALSGSDTISYTAPDGHSLTHIKVVYSREGAGGGGIHIGTVEKTYAASTGDIWTAEALALVGTADIAPSGSVTVNEESAVTLTSTGGNLSSSAHQLYFAHQQIEMSDFVFTARVASVEGATVASSNSYRFGLMVMSDLDTQVDYANLAGWADVGFYFSGTTTLVGSRANMKPDGSRTRTDINGLAIGHYFRIEVYDDGVNKRVRRLTSTDGVTFIQANSTTDFKATSETDSWYVGFYGAPGENEITVEFDNISIEPYVAP
ncbi:MAG TPA: fibronectin type III domain-containing protein [Cellvibrio sp.]|nr:fibronectin type III domain-containing protein [Cellvibrio sp.]